jgi:hypothetical protein
LHAGQLRLRAMPVPRANEEVGVKGVEAADPAAIKMKRVGTRATTRQRKNYATTANP